jgi:hypothetical protein
VTLCARRKLSFMPRYWLPLVVGLFLFLVGSMEGWKNRCAYKPKRYIQMTLKSEEVRGDY